MADVPPVNVMTTAQLWTILIPVIATSIILPMWNMWITSSNAVQAAKAADDNKKAIAVVAENQEATHAKQDETTAKVEEIHKITSMLVRGDDSK